MTDPHEVAADPRIREVLNTLGEGVTIADATGRIVFSNKAADHLLGVTASAGDPGEWAEHYGVFLPDGTTPFPTEDYPLVRAVAGEQTRAVEMLVRNPNVPDGVLLSVTGRPMRSVEGKVTGATVVFRDVTRMRAVEGELRQALRARDDFSALIVHDLKSPLAAVMTLTDLLRMTPGIGAEALDVVGDLRTAARSMHRMVMDLLDLHVAENGALALRHQRVPVTDLMRALSFEIAPAARAHGCLLDAPDVGPEMSVWGDRDLIDRVLFNLVDNCFKYGPQGGRIEVRARESHPGRVRLEVADEGPGVPEELRAAIFEKFARAERLAEGRHQHSRGVGLSFARAVVEAHGGRIWVEDNTPRGARFCLELASEPGAAA